MCLQAPVEPESQDEEKEKKEEEEEEVTESEEQTPEEPLEKVVLDDFSDIMLPGKIIINNKIIKHNNK